jgi:hypothetical protein
VFRAEAIAVDIQLGWLVAAGWLMTRRDPCEFVSPAIAIVIARKVRSGKVW